MITLAVDTSLATTSVALLDDDDIRAELFIHTGRNHAEVLLPAIEHVLVSAGTEQSRIDLFAVTVGPGSFTGLRVGVSTVKGLAFVLQKPVVGVSSLDVLVLNMGYCDPSMAVCPMVDAGRGEVYAALYAPSGPDGYEKTRDACVARPGEFVPSIEGDAVFLGDGAEKHQTVIRDMFPGRPFFAPLRCNLIRGGAVGIMGRKKFREGHISDIMELVPAYIRPSYASGEE